MLDSRASRIQKESPTSTRLKGKARKAAKQAAGPPGPAAPRKSKYILATKNYLPLAQFIVDHHKDKTKDVVDVPREFSLAIDRAISAGATLDMTADETHKFFVGVLEQVRDTLKPLFWEATPAASAAKKGPESPPSTKPASSNPFEILGAYELPDLDLAAETPAEEPTSVPSGASKKARADTFIEYEAESSNSAAERFLAFIALGRDMNALREQVKTLWKAYANRKLSLTSVAIATSTAISLARAIEEPVSSLFKPDGHVEGMITKLLKSICAMRGVPMGTPSVGGSYPFDMKLYDTNDFCMINALIFLNGWLAQVDGFDEDDAGMTSSYNGSFGWNDKTVPYHSLSNQKKFEADRAHILEVLPEFHRLGGFAFNRSPKLSPPLLLATSLHLDVVRILGDEIDRPYREMATSDGLVHRSLTEQLEYHSSPHVLRTPGGYTVDTEKTIKRFQKEVEYWREGENQVLSAHSSIGVNTKPTTLLKRHPLYCGLWVAEMRGRLHQTGVAVNHAFGSILYAGHLYNALETQGLIPDDKKWDDMELFFEAQGGRDTFFVGEAPKNAEDFHKQICLVMGFSATSFNPNTNTRNKGKLQATKKGPRTLKDQGRVSLLFRNQFAPGSSNFNLTADDVDAILYPKRSGNKSKQNAVAAPVQLVAALAHALEEEIPALMPDYLQGHRICWTLFRNVRDAIQDRMQRWLGPDWITQEYQLPFAVGFIFRSLCGDQTLSATRELLEMAADAYRKTLCPEDDADTDLRAAVKTKMDVLLATAKLRQVEADPTPEERALQRREVEAVQRRNPPVDHRQVSNRGGMEVDDGWAPPAAQALRAAGLNPIQTLRDINDINNDRDGDWNRGERMMRAYQVLSRLGNLRM
ncbi:hypothetical protein QBC34DRAFT_493496 [Podospora aff. communis PSN243]|uniref:DUF6604 domain-containing protein n=1 Tax=Podospora aff. communis PSN243 TaxID=3040156 RepID=A0AAV9GTB6_9PEZI|nr:hypothetical protein QBC34DRAFT_493496 [Podospora aff. communis PSN243]